MTFIWEVVSTRTSLVTAQFVTDNAAKDYARFRNDRVGWRAWKARKIEGTEP